jgi:O-Antigen ligase
VAVTSVFAAIGVYQAWSHAEILAKQDVQLANAYSSFFRVTAVFQDPSVYGRHLVLGIVVLLTVLWLGLLRPAVGLPVLGLLALGLYFSYSQTSFVALFCAVLVVALVAGDRLTRRVVVGVSATVVLVAGVAALAEGGGDSARRVTSDRLPIARVTLPVYAQHPFVGVGIGSQPLMSRREEDTRRHKSKNVSHTTPLTVAAELGTVGLLVYLAFLVALGRAILAGWQRHRGLGLALAGCLTALVVQSVFYGGFFEDPFVWGIAGVAAAALTFLPARPPEVA